MYVPDNNKNVERINILFLSPVSGDLNVFALTASDCTGAEPELGTDDITFASHWAMYTTS